MWIHTFLDRGGADGWAGGGGHRFQLKSVVLVLEPVKVAAFENGEGSFFFLKISTVKTLSESSVSSKASFLHELSNGKLNKYYKGQEIMNQLGSGSLPSIDAKEEELGRWRH